MSTYKTSSLRLYYTSQTSNWELLPHKLFVVDNIEDYLATKSYLVVALFQYQKPQLELSINVDLSQTYAEPLNQSFKYVRIANSDQPSRYYYYFVKNTIWRSKSAVRFDLVLDVLNTFKEGTDYSFKDSTKITREHKDRFITSNSVSCVVDIDYQITETEGEFDVNDTVGLVQDGNLLFEALVLNVDAYSISLQVNGLTEDEINDRVDLSEPTLIAKDNDNYILVDINDMNITETDSRRLFRNIDYVQENINPPLINNPRESILIEHAKSQLRQNWYLLYRNQNDPSEAQAQSLVNPVDCYLIPEESLEVSIGAITSGRVTSATLETGKFYYVSVQNSHGVTLSNGVTLDEDSGEGYLSGKFIEIYKNADGSLTVTFFARCTTLSQDPYFESYNVEYITLNRLPEDYVAYASRPEQSAIINGWSGLTKQQWNTTSVSVNVDSVDLLDRTDARNIKLIKLPYCPYNFTITSNKIDLTDSNWQYVTLVQANGTNFYCLKLNDLNTLLTDSWNVSATAPMQALTLGNVEDLGISNTNPRDIIWESKLFNSEFYRPTYTYDSFQFSIQLEKVYLPYYIEDETRAAYMTIKFDMTRTINSKFMFSFTSYICDMANESYYNCMPIARNNEEVLYNVPYINYIRNGYQYDIKAKNLANTSNWIGAGLSLTGAALSMFAPSVPLKVMGLVTSLISMAMTTKNAITSTIQNEQSIQRKLQEAKMQTASVSGSDDVDLMSVYAENRLKYLIYEPTEIMKNMLYNLFFFAGYNSNRLGLPNHNTRLNFDYLECDAVIDKVSNIPDDCLNELVNCFKNGVTYIHKTNRSSNKWDFEQVYENWEKSLGVN